MSSKEFETDSNFRGVPFSRALEYVKDGGRAHRIGWSGRGMWIALGEGRKIPASQFWNRHTKAFAESQPDGVAEVLPYLILKTADDKILMGWLASQTDMLEKDWVLMHDHTPVTGEKNRQLEKI